MKPETPEPAYRAFTLEGWTCEELSGYGVGCVGFPIARAVRCGGVQVCFTSDTDEALPVPAAVRAFLLTGAEP